MQFSVAIVTLAAVAAAAPNAKQAAAATRLANFEQFKHQAEVIHADAAAAGCDFGGCIIALAEETAACGAAAAEAGINFFADLACIASVGNNIHNDACANCP